MNKYKKIFITAYTATNLGDDLFISILCKRYPSCVFYISCSYEHSIAFSEIENLYIVNINNIKTYNFLIYNIDIQVMIGGSLFMQPQDSTQIYYKYKSVMSCRLSNSIPFVIIGANFGPFSDDIHLEYYSDWFKTLDDICFRDFQSFKQFNKYTNVRWAPDVIFNVKLPRLKHQKKISISCIYNNERIGLPEYSEAEYCKKLSELSIYYIKLGYTVVFASFCVHQGDTIVSKKILSMLPMEYQKYIDIIEYNGNIINFLENFLQAEYIIGTRFHSIILGWKANIPVFPISYNSKTLNVLRDYGFKGKYIKIEDINHLSVYDIDMNRKNNYIFDCQKLIEASQNQFKILDDMIGGNS